jgi:hypothetical protein
MKRAIISIALLSACGTPPADEAERAAEAHMTNMEYSTDALADALGDASNAAGVSITDTGDYVYVRFKAIPDSLKGEKGDTGDTGATGATGAQGEEGAMGSRGADGKDGEDGMDGQSGSDGSDGSDGKDGADGETCSLVKKLNRVISATRCKYDYYIKCASDELKIKTQTEGC